MRLLKSFYRNGHMRRIKNIGRLCVLCLLAMSCKHEPAYRIEGEFPDAPEGTVVYFEKDSAVIQNGKFVFQGKTAYPKLSSLRVKGINRYGMPGYKGTRLWIENTDIGVACAYADLPDFFQYSERMKITGSKLNDQYNRYRKDVVALGTRDSLWKIYQQVYLIPSFEWRNVDVQAGIRVMREIQDLSARQKQLTQKFIAEHPDSPISLELLSGIIRGQKYTLTEADRMIGSLDTCLNALPAYADLLNAYKAFAPTAKGQKYIDVTLLDKEGKEVKLSDYIIPGKYNMLEFWASWCGPCRGEIPHLRHVNEVLGKDFNIISISIDEKNADWQKAMQEEGMIWTQLNVPGGFKGEACQKYNIDGVPYSLVLDGEGKILAGEVRGAELDILLIDLLEEKAEKL